jgi:hypothetical protein
LWKEYTESATPLKDHMWITGIRHGEEVQAKAICNRFSKIIAENFQNLEKVIPIQGSLQNTKPTCPNRNPIWHIVKTAQRTWKDYWRLPDRKIKYHNGKTIKTTIDFSIETLKARKAWSERFQALKENDFSSKVLYLIKLSFKIEIVIKIFWKKKPN